MEHLELWWRGNAAYTVPQLDPQGFGKGHFCPCHTPVRWYEFWQTGVCSIHDMNHIVPALAFPGWVLRAAQIPEWVLYASAGYRMQREKSLGPSTCQIQCLLCLVSDCAAHSACFSWFRICARCHPPWTGWKGFYVQLVSSIGQSGCWIQHVAWEEFHVPNLVYRPGPVPFIAEPDEFDTSALVFLSPSRNITTF